MMTQIYLFNLVLGGVMLGASIVLGGHNADADADADFDGDADADFDGDADADFDGDADADFDGDADAEAGHGPGVDSHEGFDTALDVQPKSRKGGSLVRRSVGSLRSLRFWTFATTFFGLTGMVLGGLQLVSSWIVVLGLSIGMGCFAGGTALAVVRSLTAAGKAAETAGARDYVGKIGRVLVPISSGELGQIRIELKGTSVDVLATTDDDESFARGVDVMVIELRDTTAIVAAAPSRALTA